jgi:drug/metabolite transporter (DMT)-like permease
VSFWLFSCLGAGAVAAFAWQGGVQRAMWGDVCMFGAIVICGLGYAEGARLSRSLGGWQVISWSLLLGAPVMLLAGTMTRPATLADVNPQAWAGLAYVSIFSMFVGFVFWYRGLAKGGVAKVGQLQLLQPFFGFLIAAVLLDEEVSSKSIAVAALIAGCIALSRRFWRAS